MKKIIRKSFLQGGLIVGLAALAVLLSGFTVPTLNAATAPCIVALGTDAKTVEVSGSSKITGTNCNIVVNTNAAPAMAVTGSSKVTAGSVCATSAQITGSSKISPSLNASCTPFADPFAGVLKPAVGACNYTNLSYTNSSTNTLQPGVYCGNTKLGGSTKNTFAPGVYIFKNGTLDIGGSSKVTGNGVVLYFVGSGSALKLGGSAKLTLKAPTSNPFSGFAIYMDPAAAAAPASIVSGSAALTVDGAVYLPNQKLQIEGSADVIDSGSATFVVNKVSLSGSANLSASGAIIAPVIDTQAPVIDPHENISVVATTTDGVVVIYTDPSATDNIDAFVAVSCVPPSGSLFAIGTTTINCNAQDVAGNVAVPTSFLVVVNPPAPPADTEAPVIAAHANISVSGPSAGQLVTYTNPTATDNVDPTVTVICSPASGSLFPIGTTTVTCNAQDVAGNSAAPVTFDVGVYALTAGLVYEYWPSENNSGAPALTFGSVNGTVYNPVISIKFGVATEVQSVCLAIDSYSATDPTVKLGIYETAANSVDTLITQSDPYPFAGQYVDWYFSGDVTCFNFPSPVVLSANTEYAIGVDRTMNTTSGDDIIWYNAAGINDPDVWFGSASSFPGVIVQTTDKPYIRVYGTQ